MLDSPTQRSPREPTNPTNYPGEINVDTTKPNTRGKTRPTFVIGERFAMAYPGGDAVT